MARTILTKEQEWVLWLSISMAIILTFAPMVALTITNHFPQPGSLEHSIFRGIWYFFMVVTILVMKKLGVFSFSIGSLMLIVLGPVVPLTVLFIKSYLLIKENPRGE